MTQEHKQFKVSFSSRIRVPENVLLQELEGESIILSLDTDLYLGLNKSGTEILNELTSYDSIEKAYEALLSKYDVEPERLRSELSKFLNTLLEQGIVELSPS